MVDVGGKNPFRRCQTIAIPKLSAYLKMFLCVYNYELYHFSYQIVHDFMLNLCFYNEPYIYIVILNFTP